MVVWFSSEKEVVMDLLIGFCASSISVAAVMYLHFRMYNKQQEILEEARIEAQSANKAKSAFLANMSHEIRTPINVMLGMNEMILRESESEEIRQYAKSIERSGGYLISLINNILDISRIESGKMEIEEGKYELRQLLDEVMLIAEKQAEQKSLKMNLIFDKTLPAYLIGDVIHIKQILLNLINNAVKYTKEGQIDIKVSKNEEETKLIFEVKDTGIGIKEENLPVLFDAFMRVDSKKNKKIKGTGLGLAIAKQLAEQMDGMIWVESVYGKGSSFFVQLPMKKVSDGKISNVEWKETDERKRRSFVAPQAKILIVDDNPENLMVTRSLLKRTAVFVDTAASGEECVHKVRQNVYDLILLDYMMPQMDGIDTIRELKKDVQFHIPVIALTADVTKGIEQTFLREGFCAYLSKPVMWSKLEDLLMKYLRDDLVFIREDLKEEQKIKDEEFKQLKGQLKENDIKIEEGLRLLDGDFMQYRKLMEFFMEYQEEYMRQMQQLMTQKEVKVDEITRMMHTLKSNAKAIGAIHLYEIAKEMEDRGKQKDMEYIMSAYDLLKLEWGRVFKASREFIEQTKNVLFDQKKEEEKDKQSKEEIKEKLKIFITRYQAKEAKEQIQYYRKGKISEEERNILKEMEIRIDQLDFDEAEILMKRWEGME
jgi:CheY-like chemotaxis protein/nitrogen-specific signal transduction histidine kinase/HPt (histidine-containing phosphotransfer) domain-containing protein